MLFQDRSIEAAVRQFQSKHTLLEYRLEIIAPNPSGLNLLLRPVSNIPIRL